MLIILETGELIEKLKDKGITFKFCNGEDAVKFCISPIWVDTFFLEVLKLGFVTRKVKD